IDTQGRRWHGNWFLALCFHNTRRWGRSFRLDRRRLNHLQHALDQRQFLPCRLGMPGARDLERLVEIGCVDPGEPAGALDRNVVPQFANFNVKTAFQTLVDRLYPETGDSPLPANPINVAVQGHRYSLSFLRMILADRMP